MKIKDCRILWNEKFVEDLGVITGSVITDIEIHEFIFENGAFKNSHLHKKFSHDLGNSSFDYWSNFNLEKILIEFFVLMKFESEQVKEKFVNQLRKLDEFEDNYKWLKRE